MSNPSNDSEPPAVELMRQHVLSQLTHFRARFADGQRVPPLMVGVQGPQGSGKTFLTMRLRDALAASPHSLSVSVLSIDDLYLPHAGLTALAAANPGNGLLRGRGQPGTHDVPLGSDILHKLKRINGGAYGDEVVLPRFDKSLHGGEGDREPEGTTVRAPLDIVIFEGWCTGFYPVSADEIDRRWTRPVPDLDADFLRRRGFRKEDIADVNERLQAYIEWWDHFDAFIQIKPETAHPYSHIYKWRLQQEHHMKELNGGRGMADEQVEAFVDRYIPGYVFFGDGITEGGVDALGVQRRPPWLGRGLAVEINADREIVRSSTF
ncbi:P-loop containing nucleoside triphosphate hydrolase protein [Fomitopsis serialis]|uniref:P-loop containing nucleoside triphosphate hydrolase protein n=1 Tax=Fomitopsis serialis TaxID=139415 RepID=UPI002007D6D7|nr:P-loop containing nucleoside triphosphate hydrolase protein [Neoantrodia serialis]KAH9919382.1 P-loop containing nucleoside triphosphate hydrolase protein [Neoantrodia serialis]